MNPITVMVNGTKARRSLFSQNIDLAEKFCSRCCETKPRSEFYVFTEKKRGKILSCYCKPCHLANQREKLAIDPDGVKRRRENWNAANKDRLKAYCKTYRSKPDSIRKNTEYLMNRLRTNEVAHFKHLARVRIRKILKTKSSGGRMKELLGCDGREALHLLTNGTGILPAMYHIDHHIPCSYFNLALESEQKVCFNWRNLRLIGATENMVKGDKLPDDFEIVEKTIRAALSLDGSSL